MDSWFSPERARTPSVRLLRVDAGSVTAIAGVGSRAVLLEDDRLVFAQRNQLLVQSLDLAGPRLIGEPVVVAPEIATNEPTGAAAFDGSGDLLVSGQREIWGQMRWFDAQDGTALEDLGEPGDLAWPRLSPDGTRVAVGRSEWSNGPENLWIYDLSRDVPSRITTTQKLEGNPVWSPRGDRLAFYSDAEGPPDVRIRRADPGGSETTIVGGSGVTFPCDWSPDGRSILYFTFPEADLHIAAIDGSGSQPWLAAPGTQRQGRYSPDGIWIAFMSSELGTPDIFVAPVEDSGRRTRVSVQGGSNPVWHPSGDRIFFHNDNEILSVSFDPASRTLVGPPISVLEVTAPDTVVSFDITPGGDRFLVALLDQDRLRPRTDVHVGWRDGLIGDRR